MLKLKRRARKQFMGDQACGRIKSFYSSVCQAIIQAAKQLGVNSELNFLSLVKAIIPKIPKEDLHAALKDGAAEVKRTRRVTEFFSWL